MCKIDHFKKGEKERKKKIPFKKGLSIDFSEFAKELLKVGGGWKSWDPESSRRGSRDQSHDQPLFINHFIFTLLKSESFFFLVPTFWQHLEFTYNFGRQLF